MTTIRLSKLIKRYDQTEVIHGVDLDIQDKEFIVLVGPSGCGKSTILRMIAGLEEISGGEIFIGEQVVNHLPPAKRNVGMVFQNYALYPHMSVYENIAFGLRIQKLDKNIIDEKVKIIAEILGLTKFLNRKPKALSGGQRQRVAMGRAMVKDARVLLYDEPLSNLDAKLRGQMRLEIKRRHLEFKTTTVYVTHDQLEAMTLADRLVILKDGYVEQVGSPMEVFEKPRNTFIATFIGSPGMNLFSVDVNYEGTKTYLSDRTKKFRVECPENKAKFLKGRQTVTMGLRPSDIFLDSDETWTPEWKVKSIIEMVEPLGKNAYLTLKLGELEGVGEIMGQKLPERGEQVDLALNLHHMHLFDQETGLNLEF